MASDIAHVLWFGQRILCVHVKIKENLIFVIVDYMWSRDA